MSVEILQRGKLTEQLLIQSSGFKLNMADHFFWLSKSVSKLLTFWKIINDIINNSETLT